MPTQTPRLRVVLKTQPDHDPDGPDEAILCLLAQGLATAALLEAQAEAEAALGRPLRHAVEVALPPDPVASMRRRALGGA